MKIYIKIGTMPGAVMHVCNKRKTPKVGDHIYVKSENKAHIKKEGVLIDGVRNISGRKLYLAERM